MQDRFMEALPALIIVGLFLSCFTYCCCKRQMRIKMENEKLKAHQAKLERRNEQDRLLS